MGRLLALPADADALLVPVPLHRWRIWSRGFNQAALIARQLARTTKLPVETGLLRRKVNTPPLHSLGPRARRKAVKGAFALSKDARARIAGKTVILIDDIWTTGATRFGLRAYIETRRRRARRDSLLDARGRARPLTPPLTLIDNVP